MEAIKDNNISIEEAYITRSEEQRSREKPGLSWNVLENSQSLSTRSTTAKFSPTKFELNGMQ